MTACEALEANLRRTAELLDRVEGMRAAGYAYGSLYEFVLTNGRPFAARPLPSRWRYRPPQRCFWNTWEIVRRSKGRLLYVEGYGITNVVPFPTLHAWAIDLRGEVIDVTWRDPAAYYGVVFPTEVVAAAHEDRGREYVHMIDNWERGFPLLKHGAWPPRKDSTDG